MINLLPPQYKEEFRQEENWRLVLILGFLFLIFLISLLLILWSVKIYLASQLSSLKILADLEAKVLETSEIQDLKGKITLANQDLSKLNSFYHNQVNFMTILTKIAQAFPPGIYLTSFSWQKDISQINLSGYAPTREALSQFKKNLETKEEFQEIYFPLQNWRDPRDINFQVAFKFKPLKK